MGSETKTKVAALLIPLLASCGSPDSSPAPVEDPLQPKRPMANVIQIDVIGDTTDAKIHDFTNKVSDIAHGPCNIRGIFARTSRGKPHTFDVVTEENHCVPKPQTERDIPQISVDGSTLKQLDTKGELLLFNGMTKELAQKADAICAIQSDQTILLDGVRALRVLVPTKPCKIQK